MGRRCKNTTERKDRNWGNTVQKNILMRTNLLVCAIIIVGFLLASVLSYRANFSTSLESIEQVSDLTSQGIYYEMNAAFVKPVHVSQTMANDSLLKGLLAQEEQPDDAAFTRTMQNYLDTYRTSYDYDSVFLVSAATDRYYNFNGLDRRLDPSDPEDRWYYDIVSDPQAEYAMNVDNDQVTGADNAITVFVNCKVKDADGTLLGVVGVGVRIEGLQSTLREYQEKFDTNAYLVDDDGTIELSTSYSGYEAVNLFELDNEYSAEAKKNVLEWKRAEKPLGFWTRNALGGKRDYVVARYLPELRWHLVVERDTRAAAESLSRQLVVICLVIAAILVLVLLIITRVIRRFNRRIVELTQSVEQERQTVFEKATEQLFESIYEIDVTRGQPADSATEAYFESMGVPPGSRFDDALGIIAEKQIKEEFRQGYLDAFCTEHVLRAYAEGREELVYEFMASRDGQSYYWMRVTARIVKWESDDTIHLLLYRQNIDAEKRQAWRLRRLAQTDEMTGLLTKTATRRQTGRLLESCPIGRFAYFIFDIDNFKQANDRFGHAFGDSVICAVAQTIRENFREEDVLGRIGGDEFVAFTQGMDRVQAEERADALCRLLRRRHTWSGMTWELSVSVGVALAPEHGTVPEVLFEHADVALYQVKTSGKNGYAVYDWSSHGTT